MVDRKTLECMGCGLRIVTRTQIGNGDSQVHAFPCPTCGIGITFVLQVDQEATSFEYDPDPVNAQWVDGEDGVQHTLAFNTDLLIPREAVKADAGFTPFLMTMPLFSNWQRFGEDEADRRAWLAHAPPVLSRLQTHLERGNEDLFAKDVAEFGRQCEPHASPTNRLRLLGELGRIPGNLLASPRPGWFDRIQQRVALAWAKERGLFKTFVADSVSSGRSRQLWHELTAMNERLATHYVFLAPMLQPVAYWKEEPSSLSGFVLSEKRFPELKQIYLEAFETLCHLSVPAIALETLIFHGDLEIPTRKGVMTVQQYDALPSAQKPVHLSQYPIADMFTPHMDTALRNGIGHNTARYDAATDDVVWLGKTEAGPVEHRIGYTAFAAEALEVVSSVLHVQEYFFAVHVRADLMPW